MIPYGKQDIRQEDIDAVVDVLKSDFLTQGPIVPVFENEIANKVGAKHAIAVNSATSALHIACLSLGLTKGDILWTTAVSFVASSNCGLYCGASVDFVDIDEKTYNISTLALSKKLFKAEKENMLPKILVVTHLCGQSCDMQEILKITKKFKIKIIEDASHAIGGKYQNKYIGDCRYSDITVFSFHPVKIITTAEGGIALTNNKELASKMELLRIHGITRDPQMMTKKPDGLWYYQQIDLGFNYRITEIQAALGLSQLNRLDEYVKDRNNLAKNYDEMLKDLPVKVPYRINDAYSAFHLYVIRLDLVNIKTTHKKVFENLIELGIGVNLHYIPIHLHPYYQELGFKKGDYPGAESYYSQAISIPLFPKLSSGMQETVVSSIKKALI